VADAPWRCSQCGTVNEPVANACRTCGRWPSLFDLETSTIQTDLPAAEEEEDYPAQSVEVEQLEPEVYDDGDPVDLPPELDVEAREDEEYVRPKPPWRRLARLIVPIGVVLYILISALANRGR
jgi:predicted  nucleic acid-binding Zn-ribbon protein